MDEAISPELVLVSPELRLKAIAALPDPDWESVLARVRLRAVSASPAPVRPARRMPDLLAPFAVSATFFTAAVLVTLTLTLIADALR